MKLLILNTIYSIFLLTMSLTAKAEGGAMAGGGGSWNEADLFGEQENYTQIISKIRKFFTIHEMQLASVFPEFSSTQLLDEAEKVRVEVVDRELIDDDKVKGRTCLNYPGASFILCDINKLKYISNNPKAKFVLMLHELLGLMNIEETSPDNPNEIDGYRISKRIAPYVSKVANYDLQFNHKIKYLKRNDDIKNYPRQTITDTFVTIANEPGLKTFECGIKNLEVTMGITSNPKALEVKKILEDKGYNFYITDEVYLSQLGSEGHLLYEDHQLKEGVSIHINSYKSFKVRKSFFGEGQWRSLPRISGYMQLGFLSTNKIKLIASEVSYPIFPLFLNSDNKVKKKEAGGLENALKQIPNCFQSRISKSVYIQK